MTYDPNRPLNPTTTATEREIDTSSNTGNSAISNATDKAKSLVSDVTEKASSAVGNPSELKDKATQVADDMKNRASTAATQAAERADAATTTVGTKMQDAAQLLREKAPAEGKVGQAATATADTIERAGSYLQQQDLASMRMDLETLVRQHPTESLLIAFGAGFLLARSTRR